MAALLALTVFPGLAGTLTGSFSYIPRDSVVNLTEQGTTDWVHWGLFTESSVDRKANVAPRISEFTPIVAPGPNSWVYVYQFADNWNGYSWNDGTPHVNVVDTPTGVWAYGVPAEGSGFALAVAASTNLQTLKVYVGAYNAVGQFAAYLSDASAPSYTDSSLTNVGNGPSAVYTLTFAAASPNQTLYVQFTLNDSRGNTANVTLQAAALSAPGENNLPYVALTNPGDGASLAAGDIGMSATAGDADGAIALVEYYAGTNKIGEAAEAPYSAVWTNAPPGMYSLTARATDDAGGVGISTPITVFVSGSGGTLGGTRSNSPSIVNLTSEGTLDWAHWGAFTAASFNHKASGNGQISNITRIGTNNVIRYTDSYAAVAWSDGTPLASTNGSTTGIYKRGLANGFELSAPADTNMRTLRVYAGVYGAQAQFQAFLSDFSGPAFTDLTLSNAFGTRYVVYTINYASAAPGARLIIRHTIRNLYDFTFGNVALQAATLQGLPPVASNAAPFVMITSPSTGALFTAPATVALTASASDTDGTVARVEFFRDGTSLGIDTQSPYMAEATGVAAGAHMFSAVATDNDGASATNAVTVFVDAPPAVGITNPLANAVFAEPATFLIEAWATDPDGTVTDVKFYNGDTWLATDGAGPYVAQVSGLSWGVHTLHAVATDDAGATTTNSVTVTVNAWPTVSITAPTNDATFVAPGTILIEAAATDPDGTITNVQFFLGTELVGAATASPFRVVVTNVAVGNYSVTVAASDNLGLSVTSAPVALVVTGSSDAVTLRDARVAGGGFVFSFPTQSAWVYTVESSETLTRESWQTVTNFSGDGTTVTITNAMSAGQRFYRVRTE